MDTDTYTDIADDLVMTLKDSAMLSGQGIKSVVIYWTDHIPEALYLNVVRGGDTAAALAALHLPNNENKRVDLGLDEDGDEDEEVQGILSAFAEQVVEDYDDEERERMVELFAYWVAARLGKEMDAVTVSVTGSDERYFNAELFDLAKRYETTSLDEYLEIASEIDVRT